MIDKDVFSKILQNHLESKNEKPADFSKRIGIPLSTIRSYLSASHPPSFNALSSVAEDMSLTLEQLLRLGEPSVSGLDEVKDLIEGSALKREDLKVLATFVIDKL